MLSLINTEFVSSGRDQNVFHSSIHLVSIQPLLGASTCTAAAVSVSRTASELPVLSGYLILPD